MSALSRRDFFRRFAHSLTDQVDVQGVKNSLGQLSLARPSASPDEWVSIGRTAEFTPGIAREVKVAEISLTVRSLAEGLLAERDGQQRVALRSERGSVFVNVGICWPENQVLSHLTGEAAEVEKEVGKEVRKETEEKENEPEL